MQFNPLVTQSITRWSRTCILRINTPGSPTGRHKDKKVYTRGLAWPPSGPLSPGDALDAGHADTPTPHRLPATPRRCLSCSLFLTPALAAATVARETAAPRAASRHDPSVQRPWRASAAASAWRNHSQGSARTVSRAGARWYGASRNYHRHGTTPPAAVSPLRLCRASSHAARPRRHAGGY